MVEAVCGLFATHRSVAFIPARSDASPGVAFMPCRATRSAFARVSLGLNRITSGRAFRVSRCCIPAPMPWPRALVAPSPATDHGFTSWVDGSPIM